MARFSEEFKYSIVKRMMPPKNESVNSIARETENLKSQTISRSHRDCIRPSGLDDELIDSAFTQPLLQINERNIDRIFRILPSRPHDFYSYIRTELFYCSECMKSGFHSLYHQFKLLHE